MILRADEGQMSILRKDVVKCKYIVAAMFNGLIDTVRSVCLVGYVKWRQPFDPENGATKQKYHERTATFPW